MGIPHWPWGLGAHGTSTNKPTWHRWVMSPLVLAHSCIGPEQRFGLLYPIKDCRRGACLGGGSKAWILSILKNTLEM